MKKVTSNFDRSRVFVEAMCIPSMHLDHPDEFQVVAVAEPDKERREIVCGKASHSGRIVL